MTDRVYEGMFLLDSNRYARDPGGASGRIVEMIEKCGGQVEVSRLWAEQKLAYPMGRRRKGVYWLTYFKMDSSRLTELNRASQLNGDVMRHLILTLDPKLVDAIVAHAKGTAPAEPPQPKAVAEPTKNEEKPPEQDASATAAASAAE